MKVTLTGSHGLIGTALAASLEEQGHEVVRLVRTPKRPGVPWWNPEERSVDLSALEGADYLIHLAGAGIAERRWTAKRQTLIRQSRIDGTASLVNGIEKISDKPKAFLSGSAIGYYGDRQEQLLDETSSSGRGFLAQLCQDWEAGANKASALGVRTVALRTGVVLSSAGGILAKLLPIFRAGLGGKLADGKQWMSWISLQDHVALIRHIMDNKNIEGPVNLTAPNPVTNAEFTKALAHAVGRPALLNVPKFALRAAMGTEAVREFLLASQRVLPQVARNSGFQFANTTLDSALTHLLKHDKKTSGL